MRARNFLLGSAMALTACAHASTAATPTAASEPTAQMLAGSRIPQRVDTANGLPATTSPMRVYSRADLDATGHDGHLGRALRSLDPGAGP